MSNKDTTETLIDTYGRNAPDFSKFGDGVSDLGQVKESLRKRDEFRNEQNDQAARGGPVRRDR